MKHHLRRHASTAAALATIWLIGAAVGVYVLDHQNAAFPGWLPVLGDDPVAIEAEISTAQGVIPGQGQLVEVAGVVVGRVSRVRHEKGRAVLTLDMREGEVRLFEDAAILLRPRTLLKDMILQLTPGTPAKGELREGDRIPVANTLPDVNVDELLSALDADTRGALVSLAQGGGIALRDQRTELSAAFRHFEPIMRQLRRVNGELLGRRRALSRVVANFARISTTLARNRGALARFVDSSGAALGALAQEQAGLRASLRQLPATLGDVERTTARLAPVARSLGGASRKLLPGAEALDEGATAIAGLFTDTRSILRRRLRPFARDARAPLGQLERATDGFTATSASAQGATTDLNKLFDDLAHDQPGGSFAHWAAWAAHNVNSVLSGQDALGPFAHTLTLASCETLRVLPGFVQGDPALALHITLGNLPKKEEVCPS